MKLVSAFVVAILVSTCALAQTVEAPAPLPRLDAFTGIKTGWQLFAPLGGYFASEVIGSQHAPTSCNWCDVGGVDRRVRNALVWPEGGRSTANAVSWGALALPVIFDSRTFFGLSSRLRSTADRRRHLTELVQRDREQRLHQRAGSDHAPVLDEEIDELTQRRRVERLQDLELVLEAVAVGNTVNHIVKNAAARQRPRVHFAAAPDSFAGDREANVSFYSGHSSSAFAIAVALYRAHAIRGDVDAKRLGIVGLLSAGATAYLRIAADKHYLSDVAVGAAAGSAVGWMVPALHTIGGRHASITPIVSRESQAVFVSWR